MTFFFKKKKIIIFERGFLVGPKIYGLKIKFLTEIRAVSLMMCVSVKLCPPFLPHRLLLIAPSGIALEPIFPSAPPPRFGWVEWS